MKKVNRAQLRGKPLDEDCKRAVTAKYEYGFDDKRVFCYGIYCGYNNCDIAEKCRECKACVYNAEPLD